MKRFFTILLALASTLTLLAGSGTIHVDGNDYPVDTLACYQVGPGTTYTRFNVQIGSTSHRLYLLTADLTNPNLKVEEYQAMDLMGKQETMASAHQKIDSVGHRPIGSVNCNFWCVSANISGPESAYSGLLGQPFSGTAKDGVLIGNPSNWNAQGDRGYLMIDRLGKAFIRNMKFAGRVSKGSDTGRAIRDCNRQRNNPNASEIALFNRYIGTTRAIADTVLEVIFEPLEGEEWKINDTMQCRVLSRNNTGGTTLTGLQGALQGRGARGNWLSANLQVGDTFQIDLVTYAVSETPDDNYSGDSIAPRILQMVTGNALIMADGQLTSRNTNEGYNNQNYPRTVLATNNEGNRLWLLVSQSPGNYTAQMCQMLRHDGATWAAGMDGGGSAQMNLLGKYPFISKDGQPRAVANSLFLVSTAPDDSVVARLEFVDSEAITTSTYATYEPSLRAYNQYGWLLSESFSDYTLSCEPASLGTISEDGKTFEAAPLGGTGRLIATCGNVSCSKEITISEGDISLALDSLLIDRRAYAIRTYSFINLNGGYKQEVDPSYFTWASDNDAIATVSDSGVVSGVAVGETDIHGTLGSQEVSMHVTVEIAPAEEYLFHTFLDTTLWTTKSTYGPMTWEIISEEGTPKSRLNFTVNSARSPQLRIFGHLPFYSIPDSMHITLTSTVGLKSLGFLLRPHGADKQVSAASTPEMTVGEPATYGFTIESLSVDTADLGIYPLALETIVFTLKDCKISTPYSITFDGITLYYHDYVVSTLPVVNLPAGDTRKIIRNSQLLISRDGLLFDALGRPSKINN